MDRVFALRFSAVVAVVACLGAPWALRAAVPPAPAAAANDANQFAGLWEDLGSPENPKVAAAALKLLEQGDRAVGLLGEKLKARKSESVDASRIKRLIEDLDCDDWRKREKAQKELSAIGPAVSPFLREALRNEPSPELGARAEALLAEVAARATGSPEALRRRWAVRLLGQIASPKALETILSVRAGAIGRETWALPGALMSLAERALPPLIDGAGRSAGANDTAAAVKACTEALAIAEKTGHYSQGRIRAILAGLRAGGKPKAGDTAPAPITWASVRGENLLGNDGFEAGQWQGSWPTKGGIRGGDHADLVAAERGVKPREGEGMLRFGATNFRSAGSSNGAQVAQVIDISKFKKAIASGKARVVACVFFNRVPGDAQTDTSFSISIAAYAGSPTAHFALSQQHRWLSRSSEGLHADADPKTWQKLAVRLPLPKNTDFLGIQLLAAENIFNDVRAPEFDGHYADSAFVTIVTADPADKGADLIPPPAEGGPPPPPPPKPPVPGQHRILHLRGAPVRTKILRALAEGS